MGMIGDNLKIQRTIKKKTQLDIADALSITPQAVSSWERGRTEPSAGDIKRIADFLCISEDLIYGFPRVLGNTSVGIPLYDIKQKIIGYLAFSSPDGNLADFFAVAAPEASLHYIQKNDILIFRRGLPVSSMGSFCLVSIEGAWEIVRGVEHAGSILGMPLAEKRMPRFFGADDIDAGRVKVLGVAVELRRAL